MDKQERRVSLHEAHQALEWSEHGREDERVIYIRSNRYAVEAMLEARRELGQLEAVDIAKIAAVQSLAAAVDYDVTNASLWRQYLAALSELAPRDDGSVDPWERLQQQLAASTRPVPAEVRDEAPPGAT